MSKVLCSRQCVDGVVSTSCVARVKVTEALQTHFGFKTFRPGQFEALLAVAHGKDVLVRMPTGGGKSLCMFLLPLSTSSRAMCVVVSPLVCLMEQQVSCSIISNTI